MLLWSGSLSISSHLRPPKFVDRLGSFSTHPVQRTLSSRIPTRQPDRKSATLSKDLGPCGSDAQTVSGSEDSSTTGCSEQARQPGSPVITPSSTRHHSVSLC